MNHHIQKVVSVLCSLSIGIITAGTPVCAANEDNNFTADKDLEQSYIKLVETLEADGKDVLLSYDSYVEEYENEGIQDLDSFLNQMIEQEKSRDCSENALDESQLQIDRTPTIISADHLANLENPELRAAYDTFMENHAYLDGSYEMFVTRYERSGKTSLDAFVQELNTQALQESAASSDDKWYQRTSTSLPQRASYSKYSLLSKVKKGDLIFETGGKYFLTGHIATVEGIFYSSQYKQFYIRVIEALKPHVCRGVLDDTRVDDLKSTVYRVNSNNGVIITDSIRNNAVKFCQSQIGKNFKIDPAHDTGANEEDWYCSELAWASYKNQGIDLEVFADITLNVPIVVAPDDLVNSIYTSFISIAKTNISFYDVPSSHWAYSNIIYMTQNGLMNGVSTNYFSPNAYLSRAMLVTILYRLAGTPTIVGNHTFSDVYSSDYYNLAVSWASSNNIVNGTSLTTFSPNTNITREQLVTMLYRFAQRKGLSTSVGNTTLSGFTDAGNVSSYALTPMRWALAKGIITGTTSTTLSPQATCTRAQAAVFVYRLITKLM